MKNVSFYLIFGKVFNDNSYSAQLVTIQSNDEGKSVVTGINHSSRLGMYGERKVIIHKMNNITDEVLSWVQENVKFCNSCPCILDKRNLVFGFFSYLNIETISCQPHFVKKFPQDIDDHCPGLLHDELFFIDMNHQNVASFTMESFLQFKHLWAVDFSFNNLTELPKIDKEIRIPFKHLNFSHNRIGKIDDGYFDNFMNIVVVDLSSNPKTTIFSQSPIIAHRMREDYTHYGNFATYFGNETEVRRILDKFCIDPVSPLGISIYPANPASHWQGKVDCNDPKEDDVLLECHKIRTYNQDSNHQYYNLIYRRCWVQLSPKFQVNTYV